MSLPASSSGSYTARKSPIDGCEVVGRSARRPQPLVVGVVAADLALARDLVAPMDVQADLVDLVVGEQLVREVVAGVRDDRDGHDRGTLSSDVSLARLARGARHSRLDTRLPALGGRSGRPMPRTLLTGATGFIGSHVTRLLVARGDEVRRHRPPRFGR